MKRISVVFISIFIIGIFCVSCSRQEDDNTNKVVVALDWYINPDHGPILVAQAMGYFKENGIDVSFITPTETSAPSQMVCADKADIALVYEPQLIAQLAGDMPIEGAGTLINKILCCVSVLKSSNINSLADLKNKTIGYASDGTNHAILGAMLESNGVMLNNMTLVNLQMNLSQALLSKRVNATYGMMRNVEPIQLAQQGAKTKLFYPEDNGVPMYSELLIAVKKDNTKEKKIESFLKSVKQGVDYIKANPQKSWKIIAKKYKESLAMTSKMEKINHYIWNDTIKYFAPNPEVINKKQFNSFARFLYKKGTVSKCSLDKMLYPGVAKTK